jgi:LAO/AO transport system ATPase
MLPQLLDRFRQRDRTALSRLLSLLSRGEQLDAILAAIEPPATPPRVVAFTGAGGVGKSTLVGALIDRIRSDSLRVAVLACDPQSPLSGGALLGDRFRMPAHADDDGVFIRSLAAVGGQGALARHLDAQIQLLAAFGFEVILLETVGAGQGDTVVRSLVDVLVVLLQPETGDDLQWEKAGLLEVADLVVINKADLPSSERVEAQVLAMLHLSSQQSPAVLRVSGRTGLGLGDLWEKIRDCPLKRGRKDAEELLRQTQDWLQGRFSQIQGCTELTELVERWRQGASGEAVREQFLRLLLGER